MFYFVIMGVKTDAKTVIYSTDVFMFLVVLLRVKILCQKC